MASIPAHKIPGTRAHRAHAAAPVTKAPASRPGGPPSWFREIDGEVHRLREELDRLTAELRGAAPGAPGAP